MNKQSKTPQTDAPVLGADTQPTQTGADLKTPFTMEKQSGADSMVNPVPDNIVNIGTKRRKKGTNQSGATDNTQSGAELSVNGSNRIKTGRKPGTKDLVPRKKRTDNNIQAQIPPDDKQIIVQYNKELFCLGKLQNPNDEEEVRNRVLSYFSISEQYQQVPTVAGLALALGIDRRTLWTWMEQKSGTIKNPAVLDTLKRVYDLIASQYEGLLTQGKIVPVAGFFLMQNNFGYKNQTDHVVVAAAEPEPDTADIAARAGLLEEK